MKRLTVTLTLEVPDEVLPENVLWIQLQKLLSTPPELVLAGTDEEEDSQGLVVFAFVGHESRNEYNAVPVELEGFEVAVAPPPEGPPKLGVVK
jgi:hypothetical protein